MKAAFFAALFFFQAPAVFETDMLPGEGRPVYEASANELQLYALPSTTSRIAATVKTTIGQPLPYDDQRCRAIQPGRFEVISASRIEGYLFGKVQRLSKKDFYANNFTSMNIEVKPGALVEYLQYGAEASCLIRVRDDVIIALTCPDINTAAFRLVRKPVTEEWIHTSTGGSTGWLLVGGPRVKEVDRTF